MTVAKERELDKNILREVEQLEIQHKQYFTYAGDMSSRGQFKQVSMIDYSLTSHSSDSTIIVDK